PRSRPIIARASGAETAMRPARMSASWSPTTLSVTSSPLSTSVSFTVAPSTTLLPDSLAGSMMSACARIDSMSRLRPSMNPWRSFAAWYSAFSLRSPWARASSMSRTFFGRSTSRSRLSSSRSVWTPRGVIGNLAILILLQRADGGLARAQVRDGADGGACRRQRRVVGDSLQQRVAPDRERILDRLGAGGRVDDQVDTAVEDAVHAVRAYLAHLVDALGVEGLARQERGRAGGGDDLEAEVDQALRDRHAARLVAVLDGQERRA